MTIDPADVTGWALPGVLGEIAEAAGTGAALRLAHDYGGTSVWIPKTAAPETQLAQCVGVKAAEAIVRRLGGGERLLIPLGPTTNCARRHAEIADWIRMGASTPTIARALHCHERTVRRHRRRLEEAETPPLLGLMKIAG